MALTRLDLFAIGRASILASNPKISADLVNTQGSDVNIIVGGQSVIGGYLSLQLDARLAAHYLDSCEGDDLDRFGQDRYQEPRYGASPAQVQLRFYRAGVSVGAGAMPVGTLCASRNGIQFITTSAATFGASTLEAFAAAVSVQSGSQVKTGINGIVAINSTPFDTSMQVTNDAPSAGGEDREDDDTYRERLRAFWLSARRATIPAIEEGAKTVLGVISAQAVETLDYLGLPGRAVLCYIADSAGIGNSTLAAQVDSALDEWRAAGIPCIVQTGSPQMVTIVIKPIFQATANTNALISAIISAIVTYVNTLGVNEPLTRAGLFTVLLRFKNDGLIVSDGTLVTPAGDLVPNLGQSIRTQASLVTTS